MSIPTPGLVDQLEQEGFRRTGWNEYTRLPFVPGDVVEKLWLEGATIGYNPNFALSDLPLRLTCADGWWMGVQENPSGGWEAVVARARSHNNLSA